MSARALLRFRGLWLALAVALGTSACGNGIAHKIVKPPSWGPAKPAASEDLGLVSSIRTTGDRLYVAYTGGIAAYDRQGAQLWKTPLKPAALRYLDADASGVAYTAFSPDGFSPVDATNFWKSVTGVQAAKKFSGGVVGLLRPDGSAAFEVATSEEGPLSPPALAEGVIGVAQSKQFGIYRRTDGGLVASPSQLAPLPAWAAGVAAMNDAVITQYVRTRPLSWKGAFYSALTNSLLKVEHGGKVAFLDTSFGLFNQFATISSDLVTFDDKLVFANADWGRPAIVYGSPASPAKDWVRPLKFDRSGAGSAAANSKNVFVSSNFTVGAFSRSGKLVWSAESDGDGLDPSSMRGLRFPTETMPIRRSPNTMLVATDARVYITSDLNTKTENDDVITVLDAAEGAYVETLNVKDTIVEIGRLGDQLVVATPKDVKFLPIK